MSFGPKIKRTDPFTQTLRGTFGRFKTESSREVYYVLSSIPIDDINDLSTASDLFETDALRFAELIQRDIDRARVIRMADGYLKSNDSKVIFFPPLLACIVLFDEDGKMLHQYSEAPSDEITEDQEGRSLKSIWDEDGFELTLALADRKTSDKKLIVKGKEEWFHDAGQLRLNSKRAKLVVLDGQHRLAALKLVKNSASKNLLNGTEIPVCIVFTPSARVGTQEDVIENFRELFVRVNEEAKRVSGHFIVLLQDDSYSALTVRELAESWRSRTDNGLRLLHLLEWNQRNEESTRKRTRKFSLTTISIINEIVKDHIFNSRIASKLLCLEERQEDFASIDQDFHFMDIEDQTTGPDIDKIVAEQIRKYLIPGLDILLLKPSPYARMVDSVRNSFAKMNLEANAHSAAFSALRESFARYKYSEEEISEPVVKAVLQEFNRWITIPDGDAIYLLHAFQHGLIRSWIRASIILNVHGVDPKTSADGLVAGLEKLVLNSSERFLTSERIYTRRVLWKNEKVNFGAAAWTRDAWVDIIFSSLLNKPSLDAMMEEISIPKGKKREAVRFELRSEAQASVTRYCKRLQEEVYRETKNNLQEYVGAEKLLQLQSMQRGDSDQRMQFDSQVREFSYGRYVAARDQLANVLTISSDDLSKED